MPSFFNPARFGDFSPESDFDTGVFVSQCDETYRIIGEGTITMNPYEKQKPKRVVFLQPSCLPSLRYAVIVPEGIHLGDSITFIKRKTKQEKQRVRINRDSRRKVKGVSIAVYQDPKIGSYRRWNKSLMYQKTGTGWTLIEVDGQPYE